LQSLLAILKEAFEEPTMVKKDWMSLSVSCGGGVETGLLFEALL
jgi:hypothetical protein